MCIDCLGHLENWEEFKQKCISSNISLQKYLKQLEEDKLNSEVDQLITFENHQETNEQDDIPDNVVDSVSNGQDSDNESSKSKFPVSITVMKKIVNIGNEYINYKYNLFYRLEKYILELLNKMGEYLKKQTLKVPTERNVMNVGCVLLVSLLKNPYIII